MILNRREALAASAALLVGPRFAAAADPSALAYAPDAELFWRKLPFLDRLRKVAESGFSRFEFGHWRTKDFSAIIKLSEELNLQPGRFLAYAGIANPKRKEAFLAAVEEAASVASKMNVDRLTVVVGPAVEGVDRDDQIGAAVDALKESVEKMGETEATIVVDPHEGPGSRSKPLLATWEEAVALIKEVDSKRVRLLMDVDRIAPADGVAADLIGKHAELIGYYRVGPRPVDRGGLRAIGKAGYSGPVGVAVDPKVDPAEAIRLLREADAAAKGA